MRLKSLSIAAGFVVLLTVSGCSGGGSDNKAACRTIKDQIQSISKTAGGQIANPTAMGKTYADGAAKIRAAANSAGGAVKSAGNEAADSLASIGTSVSSRSTVQPDMAPLIDAGTKLQKACD